MLHRSLISAEHDPIRVVTSARRCRLPSSKPRGTVTGVGLSDGDGVQPLPRVGRITGVAGVDERPLDAPPPR